MDLAGEERIAQRDSDLSREFNDWEKTMDLVGQLIDIILNYRQSGHPGGSRSKVHALLVTLLSGVMRWDIRHPEKRFGDRFVLVSGHTIPLIYTTPALFNEPLRIKYLQTEDPRYAMPKARGRALVSEDLLRFRHLGRPSGHAEMVARRSFLTSSSIPALRGTARQPHPASRRLTCPSWLTGMTTGSMPTRSPRSSTGCPMTDSPRTAGACSTPSSGG